MSAGSLMESGTKTIVSGLIPNQGPTIENLVFDPTYYVLTALVILFLSYAAFKCFRDERAFAAQRNRARGTGLVALGYGLIVTASTLLLDLRRADLLGGFSYLQAQFGVDYVLCAVILYGVGKASLAGTRVRLSFFLAFTASVLAALPNLSNPLTYTVTVTSGGEEVAQQLVFWLPCLVAVLIGAASLSFRAASSGDSRYRGHSWWLSLAFLLLLAGLLRESTIIPSSGDPLVDLFLAFIPLVLAAFSMAVSIRRLGRAEGQTSQCAAPPTERASLMISEST